MPSRSATFSLLLMALLVGCKSKTTNSLRASSHLRWLVRLYVQASQQGKPPQSEREFRSFLDNLEARARHQILTAANVDRLDDLLVSERDGRPYLVFYGSKPAGVASGLLAYEQNGLEGQRFVAYTLGIVEVVDQKRFDELVPAAVRVKCEGASRMTP